MIPAEVKSRDPREAVRRLMPLIGSTIDLLQLTVDSIRGCKDQYKYQLLQREEQLRGLLGADTSPSESPASDARLPQTTGDPAGDAAPAQGNGG